MPVFIRGEKYPEMLEGNMVGTNLIGEHNLPPLVGIEIYILAKTGKNIVRTNFHVPTCAGVPYIERNGDKGQLPSLIGVQKPPEFMK